MADNNIKNEFCEVDGKKYKRLTFFRADGTKVVTYYVDRLDRGYWANLPEHKSRIIVARINQKLALS